jgi:flagellar motor switch protein FliN/FliY
MSTYLPPVSDDPQVAIHPAEFPPLRAKAAGPGSGMSRFLDVTVQVSVELGRVVLPMGELIQLGEGSVLELERQIGDPVDLLAQGVRFARGEVVVVDDSYAVRITEVESQAQVAPASSASN